MRSRRLATVGLALALSVGLALPATAAEGPKHKSCQGLGEVFATLGQAGITGQLISFNARNEVTAPWGVTYTPPGSIADIIHDEMTLDAPEFGLPLCETP